MTQISLLFILFLDLLVKNLLRLFVPDLLVLLASFCLCLFAVLLQVQNDLSRFVAADPVFLQLGLEFLAEDFVVQFTPLFSRLDFFAEDLGEGGCT